VLGNCSEGARLGYELKGGISRFNHEIKQIGSIFMADAGFIRNKAPITVVVLREKD
jgi:hypothetical protein